MSMPNTSGASVSHVDVLVYTIFSAQIEISTARSEVSEQYF